MSLRHAAAGAVLSALVTHGAHIYFDDDPAPYEALTDRIVAAEGFRGREYVDSLGNPTIGNGTLLPLTEAEGRVLVGIRLNGNADAFVAEWPPFEGLPIEAREALLEMAEQLGPAGVLGFHHMLAALAAEDWERAAKAALDSRWARETPARAKRVAEAIRAL